jgi:hypothetical protein
MKHFRIAVLAMVFGSGLASDAVAQRNKTNCGPDVQVTVSIAGSPSANDGHAVISDGGGPYINASKGSNKVTAIFQVNNCSHDFTMNLNFAQRSMWALLVDPVDGSFVRRANFFNFDRVASVPVTTGADFLASQFCTSSWARNPDGSIPKNPDGTYQDNYAGCGSDGFGNYVLRGAGFSLDGDERLHFARSPLDMNQAFPCPGTDPVCQASYVRVYHPNAYSWILRPHDIAQAVYTVWNSGAYLFDSFQSLPFEITVTHP